MFSVKKYLSVLSIILVLMVAVFTEFNTKIWNDSNRVIQNDVIDYYGYLPAAFIYHDLTLKFQENYSGNKKFIFWAKKLPNGAYVFKYTMGPAIMYAPFFFVADALTPATIYNSGGYSMPFRFSIVMAALFYLTLGLVFLGKALSHYFSEKVTAIVLLLIGLGTNLFWYATLEPGMPHVYDFALASILIWLTINWYHGITVFKTIAIGLVIGLVTLIRPINLIFVFFFLFYRISVAKDLKNRFLFFKKHYVHLVLIVLVAFLLLIPQIVYWKLVTGHFIYYSYGKEAFFFLHPHLIDVLFSFRKGWYVYTPVMFFATLGFVMLFKKYRALFWPVFILFVVYLYIVASWWSWWYGGSLGQRALIDIYPFMALPMAALVQWIDKRKGWIKVTLLVFIFLTGLMGAFHNIQYYYGAIHWDSMTKEAYVNSFGRVHPSKQFTKYLKIPDYKNALIGKKEYINQSNHSETLEEIIQRIKSDQTWYKMVREKANMKKISTDSMLRLDALYIMKMNQ